MLKVKETFQKYRQRLQKGRVPLVDLIFTKMLSKDTNAYTANNTAKTGAIYQLQDEGKTMQEGKNRPTCKEIARGTGLITTVVSVCNRTSKIIRHAYR